MTTTMPMTTTPMTRDHAMLGVLDLGPVTREELHSICGWPYLETDAMLNQFVRRGIVNLIGGQMVRRYATMAWTRREFEQHHKEVCSHADSRT